MDSREYQRIIAQINQATLLNSHRLRKQLKVISRAGSRADDSKLIQLRQEIQQSCQIVRQRRQARPKIDFPGMLPISAAIGEIKKHLSRSQVLVVSGETGSGKTTQLPKLCLQMGLADRGLIGHTQPRRVAARLLANRIAEELGISLDNGVAYQIRFSGPVSENNYIKVMTDGILLSEIQSDPFLNRYQTIIVDEAHERSLNVDFILGYLKKIIPKRRDLKVIITSATLDASKFSQHFNQAPMVHIPGRGYPVEIVYQSLIDDHVVDQDMIAGIVRCTHELIAYGPGDILVFLASERDIREVSHQLRRENLSDCQILPLYSRLSQQEQNRIFKPHSQRHIILATNVAETSITVPGVQFVIDSGLARIKRYSARTRVQRLPIEKISQAAATQRAGRCGRLGPGICLRLYDEKDYLSREEYTQPEILRSNLAGVILQMESMSLGHVERFSFLDMPQEKMIRDAYQTLEEIGAWQRMAASLNHSHCRAESDKMGTDPQKGTDPHKGTDSQKGTDPGLLDPQGRGRLTGLGRSMAKFPLDPRLARIIIAGQQYKCLKEILVIVALLAIQDPRERPADKQNQADSFHRSFYDKQSDFVSILNFYGHLLSKKAELANNPFKRYCESHFISFPRLRDWLQIHGQLHQLCRENGFLINEQDAEYANIHQALLCGMISNIARLESKGNYQGIKGRKLRIFPGSGLHKSQYAWIVSAEVIETSRLYASLVAKIDSAMIVAVAGHLIEEEFYDPFWLQEKGCAMVHVKSSLYGLQITTGERRFYGNVNKIHAREIFIRSALVESLWQSNLSFVAHNQALLEELRLKQHKIRNHNLLINPEELYNIFDSIVPDHVVSGQDLEKWWAQAPEVKRQFFFLTRAQLLQQKTLLESQEQFPGELFLGKDCYPLQYNFAPMQEDDGITLTVALEKINQLDQRQLSWLVPGYLPQKVKLLLQSLPKRIRGRFVPIDKCVDGFLGQLVMTQNPNPKQSASKTLAQECPPTSPLWDKTLYQALADYLNQIPSMGKKDQITADNFDLSQLPAHCFFNVRLVDSRGKTLARSRNLQALRQEYGQIARKKFKELFTNQQQRQYRQWDFGDLCWQKKMHRGGLWLQGFEAISDRRDHVVLAIYENEKAAQVSHYFGLRRLFILTLGNLQKDIVKDPIYQKLQWIFSGFCSSADLLDALSCLSATIFLEDFRTLLRKDQFDKILADKQSQYFIAIAKVFAILETVMQDYVEVTAKMRRLQQDIAQAGESLQDMAKQLSFLLTPEMLSATNMQRLGHYPRYLQAMLFRLAKLENQPSRDLRLLGSIPEYWRFVEENKGQLLQGEAFYPQLMQFRWAIEELRVSIYAQELGTAFPVSEKRLDKMLEAAIKELH